MDIRDLHRQGVSIREIARRTGRSRNTVSRVISQKVPKLFRSPDRRHILDPFKEYVSKRYLEFGLSGVRILGEIQSQGFTGSLDTVQRYLKSLKDKEKISAKATVRFETAPGKQAQADWAHLGEDDKGKIYAFLIVLSFSRTLFVSFTRSMDVPSLIRCHQEAFAYFGGIPESILYDNMAQVRRGSRLNPLFADFASHYGFMVRTHRPYRPRTKGKVERMVDYLKDNFLNGKTFAGMHDMGLQANLWLEQANRRAHSTTGERPVDLLPREQLADASAILPYVVSHRYERRVDAEGYVRVANSRYSVPPEHVGKTVILVHDQQSIRVRLGDAIIAEHKSAPPGSCITLETHLEAMRELTLRKPGAPKSQVYFSDQNTVQTTPLTAYEEMSV